MGGITRAAHIKKYKGEDRLAEYYIDPGPLGFLVDMLGDAGAVTSDGMSGLRGLTWRELYYWAELTGNRDLGAHWFREILRLSRTYAAALSASNENMDQPLPHDPDEPLPELTRGSAND